MRIAIVGSGTAGISVLKELVKYPAFNEMEVDLYDNPTNMGQGVPFQDDSDQLLINLPADQMSLNIDHPQEFYEWVKSQNNDTLGEDKYLPRYVFGHYMRDYLEHYDKAFDNVHVIKKEVTEIYVDEPVGETQFTYHVCTSTDMKSCKEYEVVFLTIGTLSYHDPYHLKGKEGFIASPYPTYKTLDKVHTKDRIAIVGTGLASLDVIRHVVENHEQLPIRVVSRSGSFPSVRGHMPKVSFNHMTPDAFNEIKHHNFGNVPLDKALELFLADCKDYDVPVNEMIHRKQGDYLTDLTYDLEHPNVLGRFQSLLEHAKENMNWIWNSLSHQDQVQFLKRYHKILKANSNPMPPETAKLLIQHIQDGKLDVSGGLSHIAYEDGHYVMSFEDDDKSEEYYDIIINATGSKTQLKDLDRDDQLVINLDNRQLIQAHPLGGIQIVPETNQVVSPRFGTLQHMYAIGQLTNGVNQSRNGVNMLVKQAVSIVEHLMQEYDTVKL
ncbi:FAD/NAD(P)-binding protein [Staphylococcus auricularis]|uniref:FAD/NAD(P)-binding protein n=1 Tax=Staphylococcus auricularis TaxID=29379 RepID=UPI001F193A49|nr:FAD/NAD(P)-binding protein [Staphylococcus auricularis]MCE5038360.1 FAD/NAD(P)-binding protein [Staphylococcus auricularis]